MREYDVRVREYEVGDIVKLKSGGPNMTVDRVRSDGDCICVWFVGNSARQEAEFDPRTLDPVTPTNIPSDPGGIPIGGNTPTPPPPDIPPASIPIPTTMPAEEGASTNG